VNRYKIPFIVADNTYSLEFMMFERRATEVIGKSAETLHKYNDPVAVPSNISQWICSSKQHFTMDWPQIHILL
jgi:replication factor A1